MSSHYYYPRRFGLFRRFWWFAIGAGVATIWSRSHERDPNSTRRCGSNGYWRRPIPAPEEQAPPSYGNYDWAAHKTGLKASVPPTAGVPHAPEVPAQAAAVPVAAPPAPVPQAAPSYSQPDRAQEEAAQARREMEAQVRNYTAEQLGRLVNALERLREGVKGGQQGNPSDDRRWV